MEVNKYVGYKSKFLQVGINRTEGKIKKLVSKVKFLQKTIFPSSHYVFSRETGNLFIYSEDKNKAKHEILASDIISVTKAMTAYER